MTDAFTPERIAATREILARATSGPLQIKHDYSLGGATTIVGNVDGEYVDGRLDVGFDFVCSTLDGGGFSSDDAAKAVANAAAIAAALNTLPAALDEIEGLSAGRDAWKENAIACGKMLQSFTPGGSEYFGKRIGDDHFAADEKACGAVIRSKLDALHKARCEAVITARELSRVKTELDEAVGLLTKLHHAVGGETGFVSAIRLHTGMEYPWPAFDDADEAARSFVSRMEGRKDG